MSEDKSPDAGSQKPITREDLERERAHADHFKQQLEEFKTKFKGFDPDQYKKDQEELAALRRQSTGGDEKKINELIENEKKAIEARFSGKIQELETELNSTKSEFKREKVTKTVVSALTGKVKSDSVKLLEPIIEKDCDWYEGNLVIKDSNGKPRYSKANPSQLMTPEEYITELQTTFPSCFEATAKPGAKNGYERVNGNATQITSMDDFKRMADGGKAAMQQLARENPKALEALLRGEKLPTQ